MWHWDGHMGWGWMGIGWVLLLVVVALVVWLAASAARRGGAQPPGETSEETLKRRYARGEIDRETYQRMLEDLRR